MKTQRTQSSDHGLDEVEIESRQEQEILFPKLPDRSGVHTASFSTDTMNALSGVKLQQRNISTHLRLVPRLRMCVCVYLIFRYMPSCHVQKQLLCTLYNEH